MDNLEKITLSSIYKYKKGDRDIFEELMPTKVKEVMLVATLYDSYSIVREGQFSDQIFGEFLQLNLYTYPRFTSVNSETDALKMMKMRAFDLVIIMVGVDKKNPVKMADSFHQQDNRVPILLLVNNNGDLKYFQEESHLFSAIDRVFVWNGESSIFLAMVKYIEDKKNIEADTANGNVRVILLVEDSIQYYSRYLPMLYTNIMTQTQNLIQDESADELHMIVKMRARPKVILASTYEEALKMITRYKDYLLTVISDVRFHYRGVEDEEAGYKLLKHVKQILHFPIPLLLQSHDVRNASRAVEIDAEFINKNSESLSLDIHNFIHRRLGFGNFVFKDAKGSPLMVAHNLQEFQEMFRHIPDEALVYHGRRNSFSTWLMARGEINIAKELLPYQLEDFKSADELRAFCLDVFEKVRLKKLRGQVINFDPLLLKNDRYVVRMGKGSLGGKGRGIAFMCNFIENIDFTKNIPGINIRIPATAIIGSTEFDKFLELNNLYEKIYGNADYEHTKMIFLDSALSEGLKKRLMKYTEKMTRPLAVRSSGKFEDSLLQPFSGVYATYLIPNNHPDVSVRYKQLETAVKLVYASIFTDSAAAYFDAVNYKIEEEKMSVIIQEVVGHEHNKRYYPAISGIAQSYNYYPVSHMVPEDGFAVAAIGLGMYVVGGEKAFRFSPKYPKINVGTIRDQVQGSQQEFYAVDMIRKEADLVKDGEEAAIVKLKIRDAVADGTIDHCASVYDMENDDLIPGLTSPGLPVINFANILKYNRVPLADTLRFLLRLFREAMGSPVEMEYAVDLESGDEGYPTFYLLQIKPLIRHEEEVTIDLDSAGNGQILLYARNGMGNGRIQGVRDVIYIPPELFDKMKTREIATEISQFNRKMEVTGKDYILIGPGRWGSRDPYTGVPVNWAQISRARVIIETGLPDFPLEGSMGSHFFHNVTSMNVGYFSVPWKARETVLNLEVLNRQKFIEELKYTRHVRFDWDLEILMDGRKQEAVIKTAVSL
ncbi:MAG: PEP/pyruvate-binding domain-containing protein [Prolixibacteraceae bacterium]